MKDRLRIAFFCFGVTSLAALPLFASDWVEARSIEFADAVPFVAANSDLKGPLNLILYGVLGTSTIHTINEKKLERDL